MTTTTQSNPVQVQRSYCVAIQTRYLGPTDHRGSRIKATRSDHRTGDPSVTLSYDYALNSDENHIEAIRQLATTLGWEGTWAAGSTSTGYVAVRIPAAESNTEAQG